MSKLDEIIERDSHVIEKAYALSQPASDRRYLLGLVKELTESLQALLTASAGYDSCSTGLQNEYDAAAEAANLILDKVEL